MIGDNESNFPHKLLLTNRHIANLYKVFGNYVSTDIKLSKSQSSKMINKQDFWVGSSSITKNWITTNKKCN